MKNEATFCDQVYWIAPACPVGLIVVVVFVVVVVVVYTFRVFLLQVPKQY